ncbi:MAG: hypothetical protein JRH20_32325, partial [Deltaproteobacteria bacterium]|nr:hypothetical protein [Deltaproteobacteria bacterium]
MAGGVVSCQYCGSANQLVQRDETRDIAEAEQAQTSTLSESERLEQLRRQENQPLPPPENLKHLLLGHELDPARMDDAQQEWLATRTRLLGGGGTTVAEKLFNLTRLLAPRVDGQQERAILESAVEALPDARHRQVLRARLAHKAVLWGDLEAARSWLRPCNPRSTDLMMDSAYRLAAAAVATAEGQPSQVLNLLGDHAGEVPTADVGYDEAVLFRVNAIEKSNGAELATQTFQHLLARNLTMLVRLQKAAEHNAELKLCAESWPDLQKRAWGMIDHKLRSRGKISLGWIVVPGLITALFLAAATAAIFFGGPGWGGTMAAAGTPGLVALFIFIVALNRCRIGKLMATRGVLGVARVVSSQPRLLTGKSSSSMGQDLVLLIEGPQGPLWAKPTLHRETPPPLGPYPCLY